MVSIKISGPIFNSNSLNNGPLLKYNKHVFKESDETYGYHRVTDALKVKGHKINHKRVLRIMTKLGIKCVKFSNKKRKYNSYKGKVGKIGHID